MAMRKICALLICPMNSKHVIMIANAASIPTIRWTAEKLLVAENPSKQQVQNMTYNVLSCRQIIKMNNMLLSIDQSNILNLKDVPVKARNRGSST